MSGTKHKRSSIPWGLIFNIFIVCLTIGLIVYFIFSKDGFIDLLNSGLKINGWWLVFGLILYFLNIVLDTYIIYVFVKRSTPSFRLKQALTVSMVGQFYCAVTPSASGGQPMQVLTMSRMGVKASKATAALIQKFLVWQFTLTGYSVLAMTFRFGMFVESLDPAMWILTVIGFMGQVITIVVLLLASFNKNLTTKVIGGIFKLLGKIHILKNVDEKIKKLDESLTNFHNCNKDLNKDKALVVKVYVITFIQLTVLFLVPFCIARSFGKDNVHAFDMLCAQSFVSMVSGLVPLPGGSGAAEYCFSAFFGSTFDDVTIKSAILIWRSITYYLTIIISLPFAAVRKKKNLLDEPDADKDGSLAK